MPWMHYSKITLRAWAIALTALVPMASAQAIRPATQRAAPVAPVRSTREVASTTAPAVAWVELNFPQDVELRTIVDYIAKRLGLNVLYDERLDGKKLTLAAPARVPADSLLGLLQNVLKLKGFALVDADSPGWKRIAVIGEPSTDADLEFVAVKHSDPSELAPDVKRLLLAKIRAGLLPGTVGQSTSNVDVTYDPRTRQLVLIGSKAEVAFARKLIETMDVAQTKEETPVHFYKLANTTAAEVLETIRSLDSDSAGGGPSSAGTPMMPVGSTRAPSGATRAPRAPNVARQSGTTGGNSQTSGIGGGGGGGLGSVGSVGNVGSGVGAGRRASSATNGLSSGSTAGQPLAGGAGSDSTYSTPTDVAPRPSASTGVGSVGSPEPVRSRLATVAADANTNSIIVVGPPSAQRVYEQLIKQLDRRRPQVLIQSTIVTVDTSQDFRLGVEISGRRSQSPRDQFVFSSFGLSQADPKTGQLTITPGLGFNGALLNADVADLIIQALKSNSHSRIVATPRILVNDNATGNLFSVAESPFTSVNASQTIATTSFAGYAEAGTEITLTPHISDADYLQLEYEVALSSFTGLGANGIPPPRQTDKVASEVTIPDGSTIVVGGLNRHQSRSSVDAVPLLGELPVLGNLFRSQMQSDSNTTLFVFLRPIILRDDEFKDLQFLSDRDLRAADLPDGFPRSEPLLVQ